MVLWSNDEGIIKMHNRYGLHWANVPIDERLKNLALSIGGDCYLVIDGAWGAIPKIREARPNAIIVNRHAVANWIDMKPREWADQMAELYHNHDTQHVELECEPDIFPNFPGWGQPIIDRLKFAADWNIEVAERLIATCPGVIIHSAPLAHERIDLPQWFRIWKPLLDVCDVLDMHCYWEKDGQYFRPGLYDPEESWHRAFRYRKIHDFLESQGYHIPMMVTECGNFAPDRPDYADELIYYFSQMEDDADYLLGGCVFILKSNQPNWVNDLTRQPNIEAFFKKIADAPKKVLPYPEPGGGGMEIPEWLENIKDALKKHPTKKYGVRPLTKIDAIVVHHTATDTATPEAVANWHVDHNDWPGAGYHIYVRKSGKTCLMNSLDTISYHCYNHNEHTIGLAFEGDFTRQSATQQEIEMGKRVVAWLREELGELKVIGHKDMPDNSTACPGEFPIAALTEEPEPSELEILQKKHNDLRGAAKAARNTLDGVLG